MGLWVDRSSCQKPIGVKSWLGLGIFTFIFNKCLQYITLSQLILRLNSHLFWLLFSRHHRKAQEAPAPHSAVGEQGGRSSGGHQHYAPMLGGTPRYAAGFQRGQRPLQNLEPGQVRRVNQNIKLLQNKRVLSFECFWTLKGPISNVGCWYPHGWPWPSGQSLSAVFFCPHWEWG